MDAEKRSSQPTKEFKINIVEGEIESKKGYLETTITAHEDDDDFDTEEIDEFFKGERRKFQKWMNDNFKIRVTTTDPLHRDIP